MSTPNFKPKIQMRSFIACLCVIAVTGCYQDSPTPGPISREVTLAPGESTIVEGAGLTIKFNGVSGDSRCPGDAICITGGSADVSLELTDRNGARQQITIPTGNPQPVKYSTFTVELTQLAPYPFTTRPIQPADYRATVAVKR